MERGCVYVCVCVCLVGGRTSHHCNFRPSRHGDRAWAHVVSQFTNTRQHSFLPLRPAPLFSCLQELICSWAVDAIVVVKTVQTLAWRMKYALLL